MPSTSYLPAISMTCLGHLVHADVEVDPGVALGHRTRESRLHLTYFGGRRTRPGGVGVGDEAGVLGGELLREPLRPEPDGKVIPEEPVSFVGERRRSPSATRSCISARSIL